jgi:hypothetical protein
MRLRSGFALTALICGFTLGADAQAQLYGSDNLGNLFTVSTVTGMATSVGVPGTLGGACCTEIEYDPVTGTAWAQDSNGGFVITEFSIATGVLAAPPSPTVGAFNSLEYAGGVLYGAWIAGGGGASPSTFAVLDPTTGISVPIGLTGVGPLAGLAWDGLTMYAVAGGPGPAAFYTVSLVTGIATFVGSTGVQLGSLQFGPGGLLYAGGTGPDTGDIFVITPATGAAALLGNYGLGGSVTGLTLVGGGGDPLAPMAMTFSVDVQGPTAQFGLPDSFFGALITDGDILTPFFPGLPGPNLPSPGPLPPPGIEIGAFPGVPYGVAAGGLGIFPGFFINEVDALSYGLDDGDTLYFSVDEFAVGIPTGFPDVFSEGAFGGAEASADVFLYTGPLLPTPPGPSPGNFVAVDGDGLGLGVAGTGLIEPNFPTFGLIPDDGDNLDAVDLGTTLADLFGPVFFSLDSDFPDFYEVPGINTATATFNGFSGADVLVSFAGGFPVVAIPGFTLGLDFFGFDTDDLDALAFFDSDFDLTLSPGDTIYFSVRRGSAVIGSPDSAFGVPIEEGDVLTVPASAGGFPAIAISAEALGLCALRTGCIGLGPAGDDLDALDVKQVPEPSWAAQLGAGLSLLAWLGHRRRQGGAARKPRGG